MCNYTLEDFFKFHYESAGSEYFSKIHLGVRRSNQKGIYQFLYFDTRDLNFISKRINTLYQHHDYYITKNGFSYTTGRCSETLFSLQNIVIDIDCHTNKNDVVNKEINAFLYFFKQDLCHDPDFPVPNTIVCTGRGLQLWWRIVPMSSYQSKKYKAVTSILIQKLSEFIDVVPTIHNLVIDKRTSNNNAGYVRLPGTYNTKTKNYGDFEILHTDFLNIKDILVKKPYGTLAKDKRNNNSYIVKNRFVKRANQIEALRSIRKERGIPEEGMRDLMCFAYYNCLTYSGMDAEEALVCTNDFNSRFDTPLDTVQLYNYLSTSVKKKYYILKNAWIVEALDITEEEQKMIGLFACGSKKYAQIKSRQKKTERNKKILRFHHDGKTQKEIAELVHCSQATVCRVIKKSKNKRFRLHWQIKDILHNIETKEHDHSIIRSSEDSNGQMVLSCCLSDQDELSDELSDEYLKTVYSISSA